MKYALTKMQEAKDGSIAVAKSDGTITVSNRGGSGSDSVRYGVLFYPVGV